MVCPYCGDQSTYGFPVSCDDEDCTMNYFCKNCEYYFTICLACYERTDIAYLMKLVSHPNLENIKDSTDEFKISTNDDCDSNIVYIAPRDYFDEKTFGPITGPDGGYSSQWKCDMCNTEREITDK